MTGAPPAEPAAAGGRMGSVRTSVMLGVLALLAARGSLAGPASRFNSTIPNHILRVGSHAGASDGRGTFTVAIHDFANNPMNNRDVVIDLSGCTDLRLCSDQLDPTVTVI